MKKIVSLILAIALLSTMSFLVELTDTEGEVLMNIMHAALQNEGLALVDEVAHFKKKIQMAYTEKRKTLSEEQGAQNEKTDS